MRVNTHSPYENIAGERLCCPEDAIRNAGEHTQPRANTVL
jgi:hypothetical protein